MSSRKEKKTISNSPSKSVDTFGSKNDARVVKELKELYANKLLPIERSHLFAKFHFPEILEAEMGAKPTVLLLGQYSTGKTSFIRHLIGMDYPEIHIGPEPTTDKFTAVVHGTHSKIIKGNALTGVSELPFAGLSVFGTGFLNKFAAAVTPAPLLQHINIIDTPGVLSGEKQRTSRGYDFSKVCRWFAERSDLILLMFDPSKLDISDEFKNVIEELRPHEDKVHCVLNKADSLDQESLMRVYGALLWSMGKVFRGAEVTRVYVGSFHDDKLAREEHEALFAKDRAVLMEKLKDLNKSCGMRKVNEMVKRIRLATVNVCVLGHLRSQLPYFWGKEAAQENLTKSLPEIFKLVERKYGLSNGDFPDLEEFQKILRMSDFSTFPNTNRRVLEELQEMLTVDIPRIVSQVHGISTPELAGDDDADSKLQNGVEANNNSNSAGQNQQIQQLKLDSFEEHSNDPLQLMVAVVSFIVVMIAVLTMSYLDDHRTLLRLQGVIQRWLAQFVEIFRRKNVTV